MRGIIRSRPSPAVVVASVALLVAVGGVASASIPGDSAVVHACYQKKGGVLRVIDTARHGFSGKCRTSEKGLSWNQQGPRGLPGTAGAGGAPGVPGTPGAPAPAGTALGWAHVLPDGTVDSGHNVTTANVTHPFETGYCFIGLGFMPHAAVVSLDGFNFTAKSTDTAQVHLGNFGAKNCPEGVQAAVHVQVEGPLEPFSIIFE